MAKIYMFVETVSGKQHKVDIVDPSNKKTAEELTKALYDEGFGGGTRRWDIFSKEVHQFYFDGKIFNTKNVEAVYFAEE
jgi:hypothetical protein